MRVLVVEDERALADAIARGLRREGMAVDVAYRGDSADELLSVNDYDVVVLDRDLPGLHGDEVARRLAARGSLTRILLLTAATSLTDRVNGLELGADDLEADEQLTIYTEPGALYTVLEGLQGEGLEAEVAQLTKIAQLETELSDDDAGRVVRLIEALEDLDDVQSVYTTANLRNAAL